MAVVGLEGIQFNGPHGFYKEEEQVGNDFIIDVYVATSTRRAAMMDDLEQTVNYETIYLIVQSEFKKSAQLIETLANRIEMRLTEFYEGNISGVRIVLRKLNPPLGGQVNAAYVEVSTGSFGQQKQRLTFR